MLGLQQAEKTRKCLNCPLRQRDDQFPFNKSTKKHTVRCANCTEVQKQKAIDRKKRKLSEIVDGVNALCGKCAKVLPVKSFGTLENGELYKACTDCRAYEVEYGKTDKGKERYLTFAHSAKGAESRKRYRAGDAAVARKVRHTKSMRERRRADPLLRKREAIKCAASNTIAGRISESCTFVERTGFSSTAEFLSVLKVDAKKKGLEWSEYGTKWQIDHKIPQEAFDFDNDDDIRRCWSPKNVHCLSKADNKAKSCKLLDHYLMEAGAENFPVSWNGQLPSEEFKKNFHDQHFSRRGIAGPSTEPLSDQECPDSD